MLGLVRWLLFEGEFNAPAGYILTRYGGPKYKLTRFAMDPTYIYLKNDHTVDDLIDVPVDATRVVGPASGLTGLTARIALTDTGVAIGSCTVTLAEAGSTGRYYGTIGKATIDTDLASLEGQHVWEIISDGASIQGAKELIVVDRVLP